MNKPLSFEQWCYEVDIESKYEAFHDEYGDAACLLSMYKQAHYEEYLEEFRNMNPTIYKQLAEEKKDSIPQEFWDMMESKARENGYSSGQLQVDLILMNLVNDFVEASEKYTARTGKTLV
jgi:hypothetical protein